jgi:hypothetical protein
MCYNIYSSIFFQFLWGPHDLLAGYREVFSLGDPSDLKRLRARLNLRHGVVCFFRVFVILDHLSNRTSLPAVGSAKIVCPALTLLRAIKIERHFDVSKKALAPDALLLDVSILATASGWVDEKRTYSIYVDVSAHINSPFPMLPQGIPCFSTVF